MAEESSTAEAETGSEAEAAENEAQETSEHEDNEDSGSSENEESVDEVAPYEITTVNERGYITYDGEKEPYEVSKQEHEETIDEMAVRKKDVKTSKYPQRGIQEESCPEGEEHSEEELEDLELQLLAMIEQYKISGDFDLLGEINVFRDYVRDAYRGVALKYGKASDKKLELKWDALDSKVDSILHVENWDRKYDLNRTRSLYYNEQRPLERSKINTLNSYSDSGTLNVVSCYVDDLVTNTFTKNSGRRTISSNRF